MKQKRLVSMIEALVLIISAVILNTGCLQPNSNKGKKGYSTINDGENLKDISEIYKITKSGMNCVISVSPNKEKYSYGETVAIEVKVNEDYEFESTIINGRKYYAPIITYKIIEDVNISSTAIPVKKKYSVNILNPDGGRIQISPVQTEYEEGSKIIIKAIPNNEYMLKKIIVNNAEYTSSTIEYSIYDNCEINAKFQSYLDIIDPERKIKCDYDGLYNVIAGSGFTRYVTKFSIVNGTDTPIYINGGHLYLDKYVNEYIVKDYNIELLPGKSFFDTYSSSHSYLNGKIVWKISCKGLNISLTGY